MSREKSEIYEFEQYRLDVGEHRLQLLSGGVIGSLPEKSFQTLVVLLRNRGALVTKEELMNAVWPNAVVEENNLGKAIHVIRQFLKDTGPDHKFIETIPKHGYRFIGTVTCIGLNGETASTPASSERRAFPGHSPAYDLYVRGKVKAGGENIEDTENAIKVLEAAIAIDPFFAPAY